MVSLNKKWRHFHLRIGSASIARAIPTPLALKLPPENTNTDRQI